MRHVRIDTGDPRIVVVMPIFKHSVLVVEAIESVLAQETAFPVRLLLVNDGCPFVETDEVCRRYALAHPERIVYLRKANGGLSSARNHGIDFGLRTWPAAEAFYFLDADNRLRPPALARAMAVLDGHADCDWVYPNVDMFGVRWAGDYGGPYSLLMHTQMNVSEAGSLVRRRVFEAGVRFDTDLKLGYEDWDFFLTAAESGFRGRNLDAFGFMYRKRPESMLADSHRDDAEIRGALLRKHKKLFRLGSLLALEQAEAPRYAIHLADRGEYLLTVDPARGGQRVTAREFEQRFWAARVSPGRHHVPPFLIVTTQAALDGLLQAGVLHWALWRLEDGLRHQQVGALVVESGGDRLTVAETASGKGRHLEADLLMFSPRLIQDTMTDAQTLWIDTFGRANCDPSVFAVTLGLPDCLDADLDRRHALAFQFLALFHDLRRSEFRAASGRSWDWRAPGLNDRRLSHEAVRAAVGGRAVIPRVPTGRNIAFLLPVVEFGGVEKVTLAIAREFKRLGWSTHLVVLLANSAAVTPEWTEAFDSFGFLCDPGFPKWDGQTAYEGVDLPHWGKAGDHDRAIGLLGAVDVVVNCHGAGAHGMMGALRRQGVKTVASLHITDLTTWGQPNGHTYLGIAYEHAYDHFITCSRQLADWCRGMGIPGDKVTAVVNAAGYEMPEDEIDDALEQRFAAPPRRRLRALFLGRLDRQKGLHKLHELVAASEARQAPWSFRIIGKAVVEGQDLPTVLARRIEPPIYDPAELTKAYLGCDVLLLLSDYEGLPLTILEAMRLGVVVIATDVGAVSEVVEDGVNGFLIPRDGAAHAAGACLQRLEAEPDLIVAIGRRAAQDMRGRSWKQSVGPFAEAITASLRPKPARRT